MKRSIGADKQAFGFFDVLCDRLEQNCVEMLAFIERITFREMSACFSFNEPSISPGMLLPSS
ncbi:hypothetical protein ACFL27_26770 [candidate division CSSED10-310 bacterium]|uniref:Uncharacterized protein n=1 Tax=candidate division CSSED10-310 bacterium TaxID=2855610 RepID=A0ABV6Z5S8_UNCC1